MKARRGGISVFDAAGVVERVIVFSGRRDAD
jgi:hypothetical protein